MNLRKRLNDLQKRVSGFANEREYQEWLNYARKIKPDLERLTSKQHYIELLKSVMKPIRGDSK